MTLSRDSIGTLSGQEMIEALAIRVMGWKMISDAEYCARIRHGDVIHMNAPPLLQPNEFVQGRLQWNPLTDWNATHRVLAKILETHADSFTTQIVVVQPHTISCPGDLMLLALRSSQRHICEAALLATL